MTLGKTITRGGLPVLQLPDACLTGLTWRQIANTQLSRSPFTRSGQTNELPGSLWAVDWAYPEYDCCDETIGEIRAFLVRLRGAAGRFFVRDPAWLHCRVLGNSNFVTKTITLPGCDAGDDYLYPALDLYPEDTETLYPSATYSETGWPPYTFTLSAGFDSNQSLIVQVPANAGSTTLTIKPLQNNFVFTNSNPWDYSKGVRPDYEERLKAAIDSLTAQLGYNTDKPLLRRGDWIQIDDQLRMIVESAYTGESVIQIEPPLAYPVSAGTPIDYKTPGVIMRLIDDEQVSFGVVADSITRHSPITFKAIEAL